MRSRPRAHRAAADGVARATHEIVALGASVPTVATVFGELAPAASFAVGDGPLRLLRDLGARVPISPADDLEAISRATGGAGGVKPPRHGLSLRTATIVSSAWPRPWTTPRAIAGRARAAPGLMNRSTQNGARYRARRRIRSAWVSPCGGPTFWCHEIHSNPP